MIKTVTPARSALTPAALTRSALALAALAALLVPVTLAGAREIADPPVVNLARLGSSAALTAPSLNEGLAAYAFTGQTAEAAQARMSSMQGDFTRLGFQRGWQQHTLEGDVQTYHLTEPDLSIVSTLAHHTDGQALSLYAVEGRVRKGEILY